MKIALGIGIAVHTQETRFHHLHVAGVLDVGVVFTLSENRSWPEEPHRFPCGVLNAGQQPA